MVLPFSPANKVTKTIKKDDSINKKQRKTLFRKLNPETWHTFCMMEASYASEVAFGKTEVAKELSISLPTLSKDLTTSEGHGLVRQVPGGFILIYTIVKNVQLGNKPKHFHVNQMMYNQCIRL